MFCCLTHHHHLAEPADLFTCAATNQTLTPRDAFQSYCFDPHSRVHYRGHPLNAMIHKVATVSERASTPTTTTTSLEMLIGYDPPTDAFAFIEYEKDASCLDPSDTCMLCLENLSTPHPVQDIAVRVDGKKCFHNLHFHCYQRLLDRKMSPAPCCDRNPLQNKLTAYIRPKNIIVSKFARFSRKWDDKIHTSLEQDPVTASSLERILAFVYRSFSAEFVDFPTQPFKFFPPLSHRRPAITPPIETTLQSLSNLFYGFSNNNTSPPLARVFPDGEHPLR